MIVIYKVNQEKNYIVKTKKHQGKDFLVVPVTMMVEGVHNGSHGRLFHPIT